MKIKKLNEDIQHCWFGYYLDIKGNKKYFYMTKDSTSKDPDEASEIMEDSIPEPFTKFAFQGSVANTQAEKQGWRLVESKESEESELITQYLNNGEFDKLEKVHNGTNVVWKLKDTNLKESIEVETIGDYITDHYDFDDIDDKYNCINSIKDSFKDEKTISKEELEQFIGSHNGRNKVNESKSINESKSTHCVYFTQDGRDQIEFEGTEDECNKYISDIQAEQDDEFGDEAPERFIKRINESTEDFASVTSLADECGENTHKVSSKDIRFRFVNEDDETKFINKLYELNIPYTQAAYGVIISKSSALDESKVSDFPEDTEAGEWLKALLLDQDMEMSNIEILDHYIMPNYADFTIRHDGDTTKYRIHKGGEVTIKEDLNEASFGGYNYKFGVHWVSPDGNNKLLGGSNSLEDATKIAIKQLDEIASNPFEDIERKIHFIDNLYVVDTETEQDVTTTEIEEYQEKLIDKLNNTKTEDLSEASYGGAFDIRDDQFFTREDIENAAEEVMNHIAETFTEPYHLGGTWFENGQWIVNVQGEQFDEYEVSLPVDMRKIKEPWHLKREYVSEMASKLISQIKEYNNMNEDTAMSSRYEFDDDVDDLTYYYDDELFKNNLENSPYTEIDSKSVPDSDGFMTDYTMYRDINTGEYVFILGDKDVYSPDDGNFDWSCDTEAEAQEWFNNYIGFEGDELEEAWQPEFSDEWKPEDIELWRSIDWKARNYKPYIDDSNTFRGEVVAYGLPGGERKAEVMFAKEISPNPIFPPKWVPTSNPFEGTVGFMYDGEKHTDGYIMLTRTETQDVYDALSH